MKTKDIQIRYSEDRTVVSLTNVDLWRDRPLLENINWTVTRGQHWAVLGRNGAGKTLLLRILSGYLWPSRGEVRVMSERFGQVDLRELRRGLGWVSAALVEKIPGRDTALEVVLSGAYATFGLHQNPSAAVIDRAEAFLEDLGLASLKSQKFIDLSSGEKQRILLARSLLPGPRLLILDEPCAGLDLASREKYLTLVARLTADPAGPTLIMVTHRVEEITPGFSHGLLLHRGRVLAAGPLAEIMTDVLLTRTLEIPLHVSNQNSRWRVEIVGSADNGG